MPPTISDVRTTFSATRCHCSYVSLIYDWISGKLPVLLRLLDVWRTLLVFLQLLPDRRVCNDVLQVHSTLAQPSEVRMCKPL